MYAGAAVRVLDDTARTEAHDESGFEKLVRTYSRLAFRVAYTVLRNHADAEDAVQETFLRVYKARSKEIEDPTAWVARIAYRVAIDLVRARKHEEVDEFEFVDGREAHDEIMSREQQVAKLKRLIAALPEELRHALVLSELEELTSRQVAEAIGIPEGTVRTRLMRARQMLKDKFKATGITS